MTNIAQSVAKLGPRPSERGARHAALAFREIYQDQALLTDPRFFQVITGEAHSLGNFCFFADPNDLQATQDGMRALLECTVATAARFTTLPSAEIQAWLAEKGYEHTGPFPVMAVDIVALTPTTLTDGYRFTRITDEPGREAWTEAVCDSFGLPPSLAPYFLPARYAERSSPDDAVQYFAVWKGKEIVATSLFFIADGMAGIYCVQTASTERGKGLGAHVTAEPLRIAYDLGLRVGVLHSSKLGYPVYERLGFQNLGDMAMYVRHPA